MSVFRSLFDFMWSLLDFVQVTISGFRFSLGGAVIFACIIAVFIGFISWLISGDR